MIDNFGIIKGLLKFESPDDFYHLQIIKRKKENPELGSNSYVVKTYYIKSVEYLEKKRNEIINLCEFNNARACINLNRRSFERLAFHMLKKVTDQIMNKDFKSVRKAYESVCGAYCNEPNKKWIIDIDYKDISEEERGVIFNYIQLLIKETGKDETITIIPTRTGEHWITSPFNLGIFRENYGGTIDVHKDNPTILYI